MNGIRLRFTVRVLVTAVVLAAAWWAAYWWFFDFGPGRWWVYVLSVVAFPVWLSLLFVTKDTFGELAAIPAMWACDDPDDLLRRRHAARAPR